MIYARIIIHATVIAIVLNLINRLVYESNAYIPLVRELLEWLSPFGFFLFSLTVASLLNRRAAFLAVACFFSFLALAFQIDDPLPIGVAILLGALVAAITRAVLGENDGGVE